MDDHLKDTKVVCSLTFTPVKRVMGGISNISAHRGTVDIVKKNVGVIISLLLLWSNLIMLEWALC